MKDRKSIRFQPDPLTLGYIDFKNSGRGFRPEIASIVLNESFRGCAILINTHETVKKGQSLKIKVGNIDPLKAEVAWIKNLEENIFKVGLRFLE